MGGGSSATPGGGWKTQVLRLPNGVCVVSFASDSGPSTGQIVAANVGHGSLLLWKNTDGSVCSLYQNFGSDVEPNWQPISVNEADVLATLQGVLSEGQLLVGQDGDPPLGKTISGDATLAADGALTVNKGAVVDSGLDASGFGGSPQLSYDKTTNGTNMAWGANANSSRVIVGVIEVTETFADGGGTQPVMSLGQTGAVESLVPAALLIGATVGTRIPFVGALDATKQLLVTATAKVGAGTGAIKLGFLLGKNQD